jgi:hypothetical protein
MTSGDESSEGFLQRWSRKKLDAEPRESDEPKPDDAAPPERAEPASAGGAATPVAVGKPEFDLSSLPSLESITAGTDIRAFLNPGVPAELARAALRRAWVADPAIRNFVGLAENDWDFTDPNAMPGFGALPEGYDIKKLVAQIFGERDPEAEAKLKTEPPALAQAPQLSGESDHPAAAEKQREAAENPAVDAQEPSPGTDGHLSEADFVQRDNIVASHKSNTSEKTEEPKVRRQHGSALPQ